MVTSKTRVLTLLALILIAIITLIVFTIFRGFFDPVADGRPIWQKRLSEMRLPAQTTKILWLTERPDQNPLSVRVIGNYESGDLDSAFGMVLSRSDENIAVMISPLGYVSIWGSANSINTNPKDFYLPWQTWPHVHTGDLENEIIVQLDGNTLSIRINREFLWEMDEIDQVVRIGIIGESFGGDSTINFRLAELSAADLVK